MEQVYEYKGRHHHHVLTLRSPTTEPYTLLPENWEQIFIDLSPNDFLSVINSCLEWNELLTLRKPDALFPLVIPFLIDYLSRNTVLKCREICRNSKTGIDFVLSNHCSSTAKIFSCNRYRVQPKSHHIMERIRFRFTFLNGWGFLKTFRNNFNHDTNPFITRSVSILVGRNNYDGASIKEMLSLFGHHLWRLNLQCNYPHANHFNLDGETVLAELTEILKLVPNLKSLKVSTTPFIWQSGAFPSLSLPKLDALEYLEVDENNAQYISLPIVLHYGHQIQVLSCYGSLLEMEDGLNKIVPNLTKLCVNHVSSEALERLSQTRWCLEALKLRIFNKQVVAHQVLQTVANFSETLIELDIICNPSLNEVRETHSREIQNSEKVKLCEMLDKIKIFSKLQVLNTEWNLVKSEWLVKFILEKLIHLQELCIYCAVEINSVEIEGLKSKLCKLPKLKSVQVWVWERGRYALKRSIVLTPDRKSRQFISATCSEFETHKYENYPGSEELESLNEKPNRKSFCCHQ